MKSQRKKDKEKTGPGLEGAESNWQIVTMLDPDKISSSPGFWDGSSWTRNVFLNDIRKSDANF